MKAQMLSGPPKREPTQRQLSDAYLGPCSIDNRTWTQVGNKTVRCTARRGSKVAREADATGSHPTMPGFVICWKFLGKIAPFVCLIACPGSLAFMLWAYAGRGG